MRAVRMAKEADLSPVVVVVRKEANFADLLASAGCDTVINTQPAEGIASSIRFGVARARELATQGVMLMTCDQPAVTAEHLRALAADTGVITGSAYAGRVGVPAYFPAACFDALLDLHGDTGARDLLTGARAIEQEALGLDVDTEADVMRAQELLEKRL